jgi:hypothetical protein
MGGIEKIISLMTLKKKKYFFHQGLHFVPAYVKQTMQFKSKRRIDMATPTNPNQPATGTVQKPTVVHAAPTTAQPAQAAETAGNGKDEGEKKTKSKTGVSRPRLAKFDEAHLITVLRPKAKIRASGERYDQYVTGMTVKQYIDKMAGEPWKRTVGQVYADLRWDTDPNRKLINIGPTVVPIPEPEPPKEKKTKAKEEKPAAPAA